MGHLSEYDVVIVGAGSGGGTICNRLVNAGFSVLLLESGTDMPTPEDRRKEITQSFTDEEFTKDWHFVAESEVTGYDITEGIGDGTYRTPPNDQSMGRMVGGSSHHFGFICIRGDVDDYDEWNHIFQEDIAALTDAASITWNGTLTVTSTASAFLTELAPGDFISATDASGADPQPFEVDVITNDNLLTILNPQGLTIPTTTGGILNSPWNRASMLKHYRAVEFDIDFDTTDTVNHGGSGTAFQELGRIGGAPQGDTRGGVTTPRINTILDDMVSSMTGTALGSGSWDYTDDRNVWEDFSKTNAKDVWKAVVNYVGFDSLSNPIAGGRQTAGSVHLDKYDERRSTLVTAVDAVRDEANLTIAARSTVDRVLVQQEGGAWIVTGVEYWKEVRGKLEKRVVHSRNVVLSAGPYGSPAILLRSGIGAVDRLAPHGIPQLIDLPGVGANILQHSGSSSAYLIKGSSKQPPIFHNLAYTGRFKATAEAARGTAFEVGSPPVAFENGPSMTMFVGGGRASEMGFVGSAGTGQGLGTKRGVRDGQDLVYFCAAFNMKPRSRGDGVRLRSTNPFDLPQIRQGTFEDPVAKDAECVLESLLDLDAALTDPAGPFAAHIATPLFVPQNLLDVHLSASGAFHAASTCMMGIDGDARAVCDSRARVRDGTTSGVVLGLRVCDNSIYPTHTRANNHLPTCAHADLIADMIIADGLIT
jgi:choline dehydrogenase-like flavoprotein